MKLFSVVVILFWNFSWTRQQQRQGSFCPSECDCIWKRGKETVSCVNLGLDSIPGLNTGTQVRKPFIKLTFVIRSIHIRIQVLDLSGNLLGALADSAFVEKDLANLQEISLSKCGIFRIDESAFKRLTNLVVLDLADNRISSLQSLTAAFKVTSKLLTHCTYYYICTLFPGNKPTAPFDSDRKQLEFTSAECIFTVEPLDQIRIEPLRHRVHRRFELFRSRPPSMAPPRRQ